MESPVEDTSTLGEESSPSESQTIITEYGVTVISQNGMYWEYDWLDLYPTVIIRHVNEIDP